jgi:hypothetical protein
MRENTFLFYICIYIYIYIYIYIAPTVEDRHMFTEIKKDKHSFVNIKQPAVDIFISAVW